MRDQALPIHQELVSFGLSPEDWMVVEDQAGLPLGGLLLENQCRRQTTDAPTHDHAVISFVGFCHLRRLAFEFTVTNPVAGFENRWSVAIRVGVIADPAVPGPIIDGGNTGSILNQ